MDTDGHRWTQNTGGDTGATGTRGRVSQVDARRLDCPARAIKLDQLDVASCQSELVASVHPMHPIPRLVWLPVSRLTGSPRQIVRGSLVDPDAPGQCFFLSNIIEYEDQNLRHNPDKDLHHRQQQPW